MDPVLNVVEKRVFAEMNEELLKPFFEVEVKLALKQMDANIAPRPNGLPPLFYKQFWRTIGLEVTEAVLSVLNTGTIPTNLYHTFITLIPKFKVLEKSPITGPLV